MPQKVGTVSTELQLDTRKALQQYNRFQQSVQRGRGRDSLFGAISGDAREFENSLGKATNRVVAFGAAAAIFTAVARATSEFAKSIVEVDKQLAAINVNLGQSADGLKKFGADLFNVARQTGQTFEVAAGAAAELARQGLSAEETTKRLKDALILSRIAGLDSASAVNTLTAAINSFNAEALTSSEVVNKFAAVDTKFAVSSKDLAEAVSRVGSTAQTAGVGLNELIGLVTSLQQTTARGGATIGNGLKTIFTRIQAAPETVNALQGIGVAIKNTDGSLRDGISILKDYASARQKVGEVERQALDRTIAGTFQINVLKALLGDLTKEYSIYGNAVRTASGATDEAIRKNEQLNQTISSLLNSTGLSIKQLFSSVGEQSLNGLFKQILQELEGFRSFFSGESGSDLGKSLGSGILSGISNVLTGPAFAAIFLILVSAFKKVIGTVLQEASTLLRINSTIQARANIQKQINNLLGQATQAELAQYQAANSVLAKKEQILAIQARINQEELAGNPLQRSFQVAGPLGVGSRISPNIRRGNRYLGVPSFADPIGAAVNRERAAGVPAHQIYVDRDPRVANFANPMGLLVANRRDEPLGGFQGVNRVIAEGGNPKTAGTTPNFAPLKSQRDIIQERFGLTKKYEGAAQTAAQIAMASTDGVVKSAKKLESTIALLDKAFAPLLRSAKIADSVRRAAIPESPEEVRRAVSGGPYQIPVGGILARNKLPRSARVQPFGPAFPINPQLQKRLEIEADIAAQERVEQRFEASQARRQKQAAAIVQRRRTNQSRALGAAFILPFASGFIEPAAQGLGINTGGGTTGGRITGALSGAAQGAGFGGIFGPTGLAVGAAAGALVGAFGKLKKSVEEYATETNNAVAARGVERDALAKYITLQEELNDALSSGAGADIITRLKGGLAQASSAITSSGGAAIVAEKDPARRAALLAANEQDVQRQNARDALTLILRGGKTPSAKDFQSNLTPEFTSSLSLAQKQALGRAGSGSFNVSANIGVGGAKTGNTNLVEAAAAQEAFNKSLQEVTPILEKFIDVSTITPQNLNEIAKNFSSSLVRFKSIQDILGTIKQPLKDRLPTNAFTSAPNLDVYRNAALTGRNPRASQGQRSQSQYDLFQELISSGGANPTVLESDPEFKKARAGVQRNNVLSIAASFLKSNNPSIGNLTNNLGDYSGQSIERLLEFSSKGGTRNSGMAGRLLQYVRQSQNTANDAGINGLSYGPNFDASQSGLAPGGKYSVTAGDSLKAAQESVRKTLESANATIIRTALQVDGTIKVVSDVLSSDKLQQVAAELTASLGKQFQAQITDLNVRLSKAEGNPVPPTTVPTNSVYGNKMVKGSDGFIRSK